MVWLPELLDSLATPLCELLLGEVLDPILPCELLPLTPLCELGLELELPVCGLLSDCGYALPLGDALLLGELLLGDVLCVLCDELLPGYALLLPDCVVSVLDCELVPVELVDELLLCAITHAALTSRTRAKNRTFLMWSLQQSIFGSRRSGRVSRLECSTTARFASV